MLRMQSRNGIWGVLTIKHYPILYMNKEKFYENEICGNS